jgi:hypothetical protein
MMDAKADIHSLLELGWEPNENYEEGLFNIIQFNK